MHRVAKTIFIQGKDPVQASKQYFLVLFENTSVYYILTNMVSALSDNSRLRL